MAGLFEPPFVRFGVTDGAIIIHETGFPVIIFIIGIIIIIMGRKHYAMSYELQFHFVPSTYIRMVRYAIRSGWAVGIEEDRI